MRLRALRIQRLPGIDPGFEVTDIAPGVNVVIGPNASGKSSLLRAVRALLYPEELKGLPVDVDGTFEDDEGELRVTRVGGAVAWTRNGEAVPAPELPPHHLLGCYTLGVEELAALTGTDAAIARQLGLELLGGYDLAAVRDSGSFKPPGTGRSEAEALRAAEERLRDVLRDREELQRQQARIAGWREELVQAGRAQEDAADHQRALALLTVRREIDSLRGTVASFPPGMERLRGNEADRLAALQARREEAEEALRQARTRRLDAQRALADSRLEGRMLSKTDIEERRTALQELQRLEGDAEALESEASRARARLEQAEAELRAPEQSGAARDGAPSPRGVAADAGAGAREEAGAARPHDSRPPRLDPATLGHVDDALGRRRRADAQRRALERELEALPDPTDANARPQHDLDTLREGRRALAAALAARPARWSVLRALGLTLALAGSAGATALAALAGTAWPLLAGGGALVVVALLLLLRDDGARARRDAVARYRDSGLEEPQGWGEPAVARQLARLEVALAEGTAYETALARRAEVTRRLAAVERELGAAESELGAVADRVGFDPRHLDADLQRWLRLVDAVDRGRADLAQASADLARKLDAVRTRRDSLGTFLRDYDEAPQEPEAGAALLGRRLEALAARLTERDAAATALRSAAADIERAESEGARQQQEIRAHFGAAGLEPGEDGGADAERALEVTLRERLERLPAFNDAVERLRGAKARHDDRARELAGRDDLLALVEADDEAALSEALQTLEARAGDRDRLSHDIASTETLVAEAERERALERAHAERQAAADALQEVLDATLRAEAGRFLLDRVAAEHEEHSQPPALRRAGAWFRRFTRNRFELDYDGGRDPAFAAVETASGERRYPAELSTGTRAQLLLAVRVAFALQAEAGRTPLPLFLDEALTTADAERFQEVADSLGTLSREGGRQLFYLTARAEDAALWRARSPAAGAGATGPAVSGEAASDPTAAEEAAGDQASAGPTAREARAALHIIDVARIRRRGAAVTSPEALAADPPAPVPAPDGTPPELYATLLDVPPLDPWRAAEACHVFHLLRDELPLVRTLVQAGADSVGPLGSLLKSPAADALLAAHERTLIERRVRGLEAYLAGWRRGRGRPVDREALQASGAVSDTFLDRIDALAKELGGDGRALVDALNGPSKVRNFQKAKRRDLEAWLTDNGFIDPRPQADEAELRQRVIAALSGPESEVEGTPEALLGEGGRLAAWLSAAVRAGEARADSGRAAATTRSRS